MISIDPAPRVEVASLVDQGIRKPLEETDLTPILELRAGDILFMDGSHCCFTNSDVSVFFLEILPRLSEGVLVHLHDVFLPYDYPPTWAERYYSEQYMLGAYLLGGAAGVRIVLPVAFVCADPELSRILDPIWKHPRLTEIERIGCSFWLQTTAR